MAFFGLFGKKEKKVVELELPPPPAPPKAPIEEIPPIRPGELPPLPPPPQEFPLPEFPPIPAPEEAPQEPLPAVPVTPERPEVTAEVRPLPRQLFVSLDDYKKVMQDTNTIRAKLIETEAAIRRLAELRTEEEHVVEKWSRELSEVERKLARVDHAIAKAQV